MWECIQCHLKIAFHSIEPKVDNDGCYFICPNCSNWNPLINVAAYAGEGPDADWLVQPGINGQMWRAKKR